MKKIILLFASASLLCSCGVQHFNVNTTNSGSDWNVWGEKTVGKECMKGGDFFLIGINISQTDTKSLAEQMNFSSYTIETKNNLLSLALPFATFGVLTYKRVKVIKR